LILTYLVFVLLKVGFLLDDMLTLLDLVGLELILAIICCLLCFDCFYFYFDDNYFMIFLFFLAERAFDFFIVVT
jgi:hypothetical protein